MLAFLTPGNAYIFRLTHACNVPWILKHGLHCRSSGVLDPDFVEIGIRDLIERRANHPVPIAPGGSLADYIPFYFTPCSVMLLNVITGRNVKKVAKPDLVIIVSSLRTLDAHGIGFVLTDRHAVLALTQFSNTAAGLARLDWPNLQARCFKRGDDDPERHERYQAEALVHRHLPIAAIERIVCYDPHQREHLVRIAERFNCEIPIESKPEWYFP